MSLELVFRGRPALGGVRRRVECLAGSCGYLLRVGRFSSSVLREDGRIEADPVGGDSGDPAIRTPAGVVSLGIRGTFCLHASAVSGPRGVIGFLGRSGKGKSTLANHVTRAAPGLWEPVADDILALDFSSASPTVRRGVLPADPWIDGDRLRLAALYVLRNSKQDAVSVRGVAAAEAFVTFVRHTVGSRLFDSELKARHFDSCAEGSRRIPVRVLRYPRRLSVLDDVRRALEADTESPLHDE